MSLQRMAGPVLVSLLLSIPLVPTGSAEHPDGQEDEAFYHLNLDVQDLAPGESLTHHLLSPEGPLRAGWIYIIYGGIDGKGPVIVNLTHGNETVDRFVWTGGEFHKNSTKILHTGDHELVLWNAGNTTVRYAFYYDQSCNCDGKQIPLQGGFVLFNHRFQEGRQVDHNLYVYDEAVRMKGALATYDDGKRTAHWPADFQILDEQVRQGKDWINFTFTPERTRTYYVFYEALEGASPADPVQLTPVIKVEKGMEEAPPGSVLWVLVVAVLFAVMHRPRPAGEARPRRQRNGHP